MEQEVWYRFEDHTYSVVVDAEREELRTSAEITLIRFPVLRKTPMGVWLNIGFIDEHKRFVLTKARKRFACPTIEEAKESFIARKQFQVRIYQSRAAKAQHFIDRINSPFFVPR